MKPVFNPSRPASGHPARWIALLLVSAALSSLIGCGTGSSGKQKQPFFTSGSREADQRASQTMAKAEQLSGASEGPGGGESKKASGDKPAQAENKQSLYERLGGEQGIAALVDDFTPRVLQDPRVNWDRKGVKNGGLFRRDRSVGWDPTEPNITALKQHMVQFLALATGGPAHYQGKEMQSAHAGMRISNPEFDATIGDIKASLDKLRIPDKEQKELLAIIESTRPQIVTER